MFKLRPIEEQDLKWLLELHNDPEVLKNLTCSIAVSEDAHYRWWESTKHNNKEKRLIFCNDEFDRIGLTKFYSIDQENKNCVLGADIHKDFRGKGLAKPMWKQMLYYCFDELSLHRVSLTTAEYNFIAQKVYMHLGFKIEGTQRESLFRDGKFWDQICMSLTKKQWLAR